MATDILNGLSSAAQNPAAAAVSTLDLVNQKTNPSKAEVSRTKLSDDFDNFILLLTTQLQHQDPTEPMDANEFTTQLVAFTGVEQQIATNENLENLVTFQQNQQFSTAVNYIGKLVDARGRTGELVNGKADFSYELTAAAHDVTILISNADGRAVYSGEGTTHAGKNIFTWDGENSFNGFQEPDGTYTINMIARDSNGDSIESKTFATGLVRGASQEDGTIMLDVGGTNVPLEDVRAVRAL